MGDPVALGEAHRWVALEFGNGFAEGLGSGELDHLDVAVFVADDHLSGDVGGRWIARG